MKIQANAIIHRDSAVSHLAMMEAKKLSQEERQDILAEWWAIGSDDPEWLTLPLLLKEEMEKESGPTHGLDSAMYEPLIVIACEAKLRGIANEWIANRISELEGRQVQVNVEGEIEQMATCPCCGYRALAERGAYEICPVCFWEDDGGTATDRFSGPNHMTLAEGQDNFKRFGACSSSAMQHVDPEAPSKYKRAT